MRICLVSPGASEPVHARAVAAIAELLADAHEVEVVAPPAEWSEEVRAQTFSCEDHRRSAGVMEAIRDRYGDAGPDYLEVGDCSPLGFVALQAKGSGDPLLARTLIGLRVCPGTELRALHDGQLDEPENLHLAELERWILREADCLVWPGGDALGLYRRYYAGIELPPDERVSLPLPTGAAPVQAGAPRADGPLRLLYLGELLRSRGVLDLLEACLALPGDEWELTIAGADTRTATMGQSVRENLEAMADGDPRVQLREAPDSDEQQRLLAMADVLVAPGWIDTAREQALAALAAGVPVLATPTGAIGELVGEGSGWLAADVGAPALTDALAALLADPGEVSRIRAAGGIGERLRRLADPAPVLAGYAALAERAAALPEPPPTDHPPRVTGVVPYFNAAPYVRGAVASLLAQTHQELEVLVVNDGSFGPDDEVLAELERDPRVTVVTQANSGEAAARNLAALLARGEYLVMLDADNLLEPTFVERALAAFRSRPELPYVTCWLRMIDAEGADMPPEHGYAPLGNGVVEGDSRNWDGDTLAVLPRRLFVEEGFRYGPGGSMHSDWELYRWLRQEGRFGAVVPERLARYRIVPNSLLRGHGAELQERGWMESVGRNRSRRVRWIASPPS
jgi:glycosyltransferase involved in cell wall biosynthesis